MPMIIRTFEFNQYIQPNEASLNVAKHFQSFQHLRDPADIDKMIINGYQTVLDAEFVYSEEYTIRNYIMPSNYRPNSIGYSVYNDVKYNNKSKFLKDFYTNSKPNY